MKVGYPRLMNFRWSYFINSKKLANPGLYDDRDLNIASEEIFPSGPRIRRRAISRRRKFVFGLLTCAAVVAILEGTLAIVGVLPLSQRRDSSVGFTGNVPLFLEENSQRITNPLKLSYFNNQSFASKKSAGTTRVFCLGGSTTFGHPYDDSTSFCGWLRRMLQHVAPLRYEVVNCGGVSYASYRIALMMDELVRYQPDLFIVYCGHNEFLEERTYGDQRNPGVVDRIGRAVSSLRISGLFDRLASRTPRDEKAANRLAAEVDVILDHTNGPESYHRDLVQRAGVIGHYRESLTRIVALARASGAQVILVKPESNIRHFSPFKSERSKLTFADSVRWEKMLSEARKAESREISKSLPSFICRHAQSIPMMRQRFSKRPPSLPFMGEPMMPGNIL
jgi:hypothetical protein